MDEQQLRQDPVSGIYYSVPVRDEIDEPKVVPEPVAEAEPKRRARRK